MRKSSEYRRLEFDRRQKIQILDFATWIVSKEDLIISKLFWAKDSHSELQLRDVKNLLATGFDAFISSAGRTSWNWIFYYGSVCMTDTLPEIERLLREKMMARTAEERFIMGAQMFDAAVTMVDASLPPNLPEAERKWRRLERIYGTQLLPREMIR